MQEVLHGLGMSTLDTITQFLLVAITAMSILWHVGCSVMYQQQLVDFDNFMRNASGYFSRSRAAAMACRRKGIKVNDVINIRQQSAYAIYTILRLGGLADGGLRGVFLRPGLRHLA